MCCCHSLTLRHTLTTHICTIEYLPHFSLIVVSFLLISLSLQLIIYYWSLSHHWHNFLMSTNKVKTQTRFMVLFTSRSSLTWGNLQVLHMASPPDIYSLSALNNCLLTSLQRLHNDWTCIFCWRGRKMGKRYDTPVGKSQHLPPPKPPRTPVPFLGGTTFHLQTKGLGEHLGTL